MTMTPGIQGRGPTPSRERLDEIEDDVQCSLGPRIRDFRITEQNGTLILHGQTGTYHAKQMAQYLVMQMTDFPILANDIEVR